MGRYQPASKLKVNSRDTKRKYVGIVQRIRTNDRAKQTASQANSINDRKRRFVSNIVPKIKTNTLNTEENPGNTSTFAKTLPGVYYQALLLMLIKIRAWCERYEFSLATEVAAADKFDDVVFECERNILRFFQIKHKQDVSKSKITITELKKKLIQKESPFSLQKYFMSFFKIKREKRFKNLSRQFFILTNTDFDSKAKCFFEEEDDLKYDNILYIENCHAKQFKIKANKIEEIMRAGNIQNKNSQDNQEDNNDMKKLIEIMEGEDFPDLLEEFTNIFRIITNYPNVENLEKSIKNNLGDKFELNNVNFIFDTFHVYAFGKLKEKNREWITLKSANSFFYEINGLINILMVSGRTKSYTDKLNAYTESNKLAYQKDSISKLQTRIKELEGVLLLDTESTRLCAVKVFKALENEKFDSYMFASINEMKYSRTRKDFFEAFRQQNSHNLLVIECNERTGSEIEWFDELSVILHDIKSKKLILIAKDCDPFAEMFEKYPVQAGSSHRGTKRARQQNFKVKREYDTETSFKYLDNKEELLQNIKVAFQGKDQILFDLINAKAASELIDGALLFEILGRNRIFIGGEPPSFHNGLEHYYVDRLFCENGTDSETSKTQLEKNKNEDQSDYDKNIEKKMSLMEIEEVVFDENRFVRQTTSEKVVLLANDPGMGKSSLLISIATKMKLLDQSNIIWTVNINLSNYSQILDTTTFKEDEKQTVIEFITNTFTNAYDIESSINKFQKKLFSHYLHQKDSKLKIVILLDGYDEICPGHRDNTVGLIKAIKGFEARVWITTRCHEEVVLERELLLSAYKLKPLSEELQIKLLDKLQKWKLKFLKGKKPEEVYKEIPINLEKIMNSENESLLKVGISDILTTYSKEAYSPDKLQNLMKAIDTLDFSDYFDRLLVFWKSSTQIDEKFTENPLHLKMLFEVIKENYFEKEEGKLELSAIYDKFITNKFEDRFDIKSRINYMPANEEMKGRDAKSQENIHTLLAAKIILPEKYENLLQNDANKLDTLAKDKDVQISHTRLGLLTFQGDEFQFVHRSFAEYFFSKFLLNVFSNEEIGKLLFKEILVERKYNLTRLFFNSQIKEKIKTKLEDTAKVSIQNYLKEDKEILHRICEEGHENILEFILENINGDCVFHKSLMKHRTPNGTVLDVSIIQDKYKVIVVLLKYVGNNTEILKEMMFSTTNKYNAMQWAIKRGNDKIVGELRKWASVIITEKLKSKRPGTDNKDLWLAIMSVDIKSVSQLLAPNIDICSLRIIILKPNENRWNAFEFAIQCGNVNIVQQILKQTPNNSLKKKMLQPAKYKKNLVKLAIRSRNSDSIKVLLNEARNIDQDRKILKEMMMQSDKDGCNALQCAIQNKSNEVIEQLLEEARGINTETLIDMVLHMDSDGRNAIEHAIYCENNVAVDVLRKCASDIMILIQSAK